MYFQHFLERKFKISWESISYKYDGFRIVLNLCTINISIIFLTFAWEPIVHVADYLALSLVSTIQMSHLWWPKSFPPNVNISY